MTGLRFELRDYPQDTPLNEPLQVPYLAAIYQEENRLSFGLTDRKARIATEESLQYGSYVLPPGTPMV
jgi:hypothetical protein